MSDLVKRLARYGKPASDPRIISDYSEELALKAKARIETLEAGITAALRERDGDMRDVLREALHGREGEW